MVAQKIHGDNWWLTLPHCGKLLNQLANHSAIGVKDIDKTPDYWIKRIIQLI